MFFFIPDLFTPYVQGRETAINRNWEDLTKYQDVQSKQLQNIKALGTLNADINSPYADLFKKFLDNAYAKELYPSSVQVGLAQNAQKLNEYDEWLAGHGGRMSWQQALSQVMPQFALPLLEAQGQAKLDTEQANAKYAGALNTLMSTKEGQDALAQLVRIMLNGGVNPQVTPTVRTPSSPSGNGAASATGAAPGTDIPRIGQNPRYNPANPVKGGNAMQAVREKQAEYEQRMQAGEDAAAAAEQEAREVRMRGEAVSALNPQLIGDPTQLAWLQPSSLGLPADMVYPFSLPDTTLFG